MDSASSAERFCSEHVEDHQQQQQAIGNSILDSNANPSADHSDGHHLSTLSSPGRPTKLGKGILRRERQRNTEKDQSPITTTNQSSLLWSPPAGGDKFSPLTHHQSIDSPSTSSLVTNQPPPPQEQPHSSSTKTPTTTAPRIRFRCPSVDLVVSPSTCTYSSSTASDVCSSSKLLTPSSSSIDDFDFDLSFSTSDQSTSEFEQSPSILESLDEEFTNPGVSWSGSDRYLRKENELPISYAEMESAASKRLPSESESHDEFHQHLHHQQHDDNSPLDSPMSHKSVNGHHGDLLQQHHDVEEEEGRRRDSSSSQNGGHNGNNGHHHAAEEHIGHETTTLMRDHEQLQSKKSDVNENEFAEGLGGDIHVDQHHPIDHLKQYESHQQQFDPDVTYRHPIQTEEHFHHGSEHTDQIDQGTDQGRDQIDQQHRHSEPEFHHDEQTNEYERQETVESQGSLVGANQKHDQEEIDRSMEHDHDQSIGHDHEAVHDQYDHGRLDEAAGYTRHPHDHSHEDIGYPIDHTDQFNHDQHEHEADQLEHAYHPVESPEPIAEELQEHQHHHDLEDHAEHPESDQQSEDDHLHRPISDHSSEIDQSHVVLDAERELGHSDEEMEARIEHHHEEPIDHRSSSDRIEIGDQSIGEHFGGEIEEPVRQVIEEPYHAEVQSEAIDQRDHPIEGSDHTDHTDHLIGQGDHGHSEESDHQQSKHTDDIEDHIEQRIIARPPEPEDHRTIDFEESDHNQSEADQGEHVGTGDHHQSAEDHSDHEHIGDQSIMDHHHPEKLGDLHGGTDQDHDGDHHRSEQDHGDHEHIGDRSMPDHWNMDEHHTEPSIEVHTMPDHDDPGHGHDHEDLDRPHQQSDLVSEHSGNDIHVEPHPEPELVHPDDGSEHPEAGEYHPEADGVHPEHDLGHPEVDHGFGEAGHGDQHSHPEPAYGQAEADRGDQGPQVFDYGHPADHDHTNQGNHETDSHPEPRFDQPENGVIHPEPSHEGHLESEAHDPHPHGDQTDFGSVHQPDAGSNHPQLPADHHDHPEPTGEHLEPNHPHPEPGHDLPELNDEAGEEECQLRIVQHYGESDADHHHEPLEHQDIHLEHDHGHTQEPESIDGRPDHNHEESQHHDLVSAQGPTMPIAEADTNHGVDGVQAVYGDQSLEHFDDHKHEEERSPIDESVDEREHGHFEIPAHPQHEPEHHEQKPLIKGHREIAMPDEPTFDFHDDQDTHHERSPMTESVYDPGHGHFEIPASPQEPEHHHELEPLQEPEARRDEAEAILPVHEHHDQPIDHHLDTSIDRMPESDQDQSHHRQSPQTHRKHDLEPLEMEQPHEEEVQVIAYQHPEQVPREFRDEFESENNMLNQGGADKHDQADDVELERTKRSESMEEQHGGDRLENLERSDDHHDRSEHAVQDMEDQMEAERNKERHEESQDERLDDHPSMDSDHEHIDRPNHHRELPEIHLHPHSPEPMHPHLDESEDNTQKHEESAEGHFQHLEEAPAEVPEDRQHFQPVEAMSHGEKQEQEEDQAHVQHVGNVDQHDLHSDHERIHEEEHSDKLDHHELEHSELGHPESHQEVHSDPAEHAEEPEQHFHENHPAHGELQAAHHHDDHRDEEVIPEPIHVGQSLAVEEVEEEHHEEGHHVEEDHIHPTEDHQLNREDHQHQFNQHAEETNDHPYQHHPEDHDQESINERIQESNEPEPEDHDHREVHEEQYQHHEEPAIHDHHHQDHMEPAIHDHPPVHEESFEEHPADRHAHFEDHQHEQERVQFDEPQHAHIEKPHPPHHPEEPIDETEPAHEHIEEEPYHQHHQHIVEEKPHHDHHEAPRLVQFDEPQTMEDDRITSPVHQSHAEAAPQAPHDHETKPLETTISHERAKTPSATRSTSQQKKSPPSSPTKAVIKKPTAPSAAAAATPAPSKPSPNHAPTSRSRQARPIGAPRPATLLTTAEKFARRPPSQSPAAQTVGQRAAFPDDDSEPQQSTRKVEIQAPPAPTGSFDRGGSIRRSKRAQSTPKKQAVDEEKEKENRKQEAEAAYQAWLARKAEERKRAKSTGRGLISDTVTPAVNNTPKHAAPAEETAEEKMKRRAEAEAAFQAWLERKKEEQKERKRAFMAASKSMQMNSTAVTVSEMRTSTTYERTPTKHANIGGQGKKISKS